MDRALREAVLERLDLLDRLAAAGEPETLLPLARTELYRLSEGLRTLLKGHRPDEDGRCRSCLGNLRGRRWPCSVWSLAHRKLIGGSPGREYPQRPTTWAPRAPVHEQPPEVVVVPAAGAGGPGEWETDEIVATEPIAVPRTTGGTGGAPSPAPPVGGHLETDHTRIHRASVVERSRERGKHHLA